jgi:hypothetical protein
MAGANPLARLPDDVAALAAAVAPSAKAIAAASADRWFVGPGHSDTFQLASARLNWRFLFEQRGGWAFFFPSGESVWTPLDAKLSTLVRPVQTPPPPLDKVEVLLAGPPFLWMHPAQQDCDDFGPPGSTPDNAILLRLGENGGVLGFRTDRRKLVLTRNGIRGAVEPQGGAYPVLPFVLLADTLVSWLALGAPVDSDDAAPLPQSSSGKPVRQVIDSIAEAWRRSYDTLANRGEPANPFYPVNWEAAAFETDAQVRLDDRGRIADEPEDERFTVLLRLSASTAAGNLAVSAAPGALSRAVRDALLDYYQFTPDGNRALARAISEFQTVPSAQMDEFVRSARDGARLIRLEKDEDAEWVFLILEGELLRQPALVMAVAAVTVDESGDPPAAGNPDFNVLVLADPIDRPLEARASSVAVEHLLAWLGNFRRWIGLLQ